MFIKDYLALSPDDKVFIRKRLIEDERTPNEWIKTFKNVAKVDEQGDKVRLISYWTGFIGAIVLILAIISLFSQMFDLSYILFILGLIFVILGFGLFFILRQIDLPNALMKEILTPIFYVLQQDINSKEKIKLKLDLRGFLHNSKLIKSEDISGETNHSIMNYFYKDIWCEGQTTLADGTELNWTIIDIVIHRVKKKYSRSNRYRGKHIKNKSRSLIEVQASVNKKIFILPVGLKQKDEKEKILSKKKNGKQWMSVYKKFKHIAESYYIPSKTNPFDIVLGLIFRDRPEMTIQKFIQHGKKGYFIPKYFIDTVAEVYMRAKPQGGNQ